MSKYDKLWEHLHGVAAPELLMTFDEIEAVAGIPLDHSFLNAKKELAAYGWAVARISIKHRTVQFKKA